jgi:hypothetical protein
MKLRYLAVAILLVGIFFLVGGNIAHAQWSALNSGYAVTTNWHGEVVPIGESITAWAGTNNTEVYKVEFKWKNETEHVVFDENVTNFVQYTTPSYPPDVPQEIINWATDPKNANVIIKYANNTQIPDALGNWSVQVFFYAPGGHLRGQGSDIFKIKATSFNTIPEIPLVGTAGAMVAMLLGFGFFGLRRKRVQ